MCTSSTSLKFSAISNIDFTKANGTEAPPPRKTRLPGRISRGQSLATNGFTRQTLTKFRADCAVYLNASFGFQEIKADALVEDLLQLEEHLVRVEVVAEKLTRFRLCR